MKNWTRIFVELKNEELNEVPTQISRIFEFLKKNFKNLHNNIHCNFFQKPGF